MGHLEIDSKNTLITALVGSKDMQLSDYIIPDLEELKPKKNHKKKKHPHDHKKLKKVIENQRQIKANLDAVIAHLNMKDLI